MIGIYNFTEGEISSLSDRLGFDCRVSRQILISEHFRRLSQFGENTGGKLDIFTHPEDKLKDILIDMNTFENRNNLDLKSYFSLGDMVFLNGQMKGFNRLLEISTPKTNP